MIVTVHIGSYLVNEKRDIPWFGTTTAALFKQRGDERRAFRFAINLDRKSLSTITLEGGNVGIAGLGTGGGSKEGSRRRVGRCLPTLSQPVKEIGFVMAVVEI